VLNKWFASTYKPYRSTTSTRDLRRVVPTNALSLEQRRQELELRRLEAEIIQQEEKARNQRLENERLELDLIERRRRIQKDQ
jgi:hypothetical protein